MEKLSLKADYYRKDLIAALHLGSVCDMNLMILADPQLTRKRQAGAKEIKGKLTLCLSLICL